MTRKEEIVGARIGNIITNSPAVVFAAIKAGVDIEPLARGRMQIMAAADFGQRWVDLANGATLFVVVYNDNGEMIGVEPAPTPTGAEQHSEWGRV